MALSLHHLDDRTRQYMRSEIEADIANKRLYLSPRLSETGQEEYSMLLKEAVSQFDADWLANQLRLNYRLNAVEPRRTPSGGMTAAKVPSNAPEMLAEGEFNRFYIRGLCRRAIDDGITHLIVYRAKAVSHPRPESQARIGTSVEAQTLLDDLRTHPGVDTALGLPNGPNSGLSVHLP